MELVAGAAIFACLLAKLLLALRAKTLTKQLDKEKLVLQTTKKEMHKADGKGKLLEAQRKQLETKQGTMQKQLDRYSKILGNYAAQEQKEKAKTREQEELLREAQKLK